MLSAMRILLLSLLLLAGCASTSVSPAIERDPVADIVITTGVHGNEPSGWLVQDRLAAMGFTVFGPCNLWGIENGKRHLEDGRDLNRLFGEDGVPEVDAVKRFLKANPPRLLLDLHEDPGATGAYLIQHGPDDDIGRRIIDAMKDEFEFDPQPRFMMVTGEDGLLKPETKHLSAMRLFSIYGLAYHAWLTYGVTTIVTECPGSWPEEKRKAYQLRVCELAKQFYLERQQR